jgi:hypothetical protein
MTLRSLIIVFIFFLVSSFLTLHVAGVQIISKSKLEKCEKNSNSDDLNCTTKIVVSMAVPSGSVIVFLMLLHFCIIIMNNGV